MKLTKLNPPVAAGNLCPVARQWSKELSNWHQCVSFLLLGEPKKNEWGREKILTNIKEDSHMQTITVKVPNMIADIYESEQESILESAIRHVVFNRVAEKRKKYSIATQKVAHFEKRYGMTFKEFVGSFPDDADISQHEDWVEWSHYQEVKKRLGLLIQKLEQISE